MIREQIAHVVGSDIVEFSQLSVSDQLEAVLKLKRIFNESLPPNSAPITLDTGDGIFAIFTDTILEAMSLSEHLSRCASNEGLSLRVGIHSGPVVLREGVDGRPNAYGPGVNMAQRVMAAASPGTPLLSSSAAEFAGSHVLWRNRLLDKGSIAVKHGVVIQVFELTDIESPRSSFKAASTIPALERQMVGRSREMEALHDLMIVGRHRLVTLLGPGGIGKTTLAASFAAQCSKDFGDELFFIECGEFVHADDVKAAISTQIGLSPNSSLADSLSRQRALLVLDCLEQIPDICELVDHLLARCPSVQILATTRAILGSRFERELSVGPLSLGKTASGHSDAVRLFLDCALASGAQASYKGEDRRLIDEIVTLLEGVPLALVLAAGRLRYMSLLELVESLKANPLKTLHRRVAGRDKHSDLRFVVEESLRLIPEDLKRTLIELSVFYGGFYAVDAQSVLSARSAIMEDLELLRDRSLIAGSVVNRRMRFKSLDVIAAYVDGLAAGEDLSQQREAHAVHFTGKAERVREVFDRADWAEASDLLWADFGNFRRAVSFALEQGQSDLTMRLAGSLCRVFMEGGLLSDFDRLAHAALPQADPELRIELTGLLGGVSRRQGDFDKAQTMWLSRAEEIAKSKDVEKEADAWNDLIGMAWHRGDSESTDRFIARFKAIQDELLPGPVLALGLVFQGLRLADEGHMAEARDAAARADQLLADLAASTRVFFAVTNLAELFTKVGRADRTVKLCRQAIPATLSSHHPSYTSGLLLALAQAQESNEQTEAAWMTLDLLLAFPGALPSQVKERAERDILRLEEASEGQPRDRSESFLKVRSWHNKVIESLNS